MKSLALYTFVLAATFAGLGCSASTPTDEPSESTGTTSDALSVYQWSADSPAGSSHSYGNASIATFDYNNEEWSFMVHSGELDDFEQMYWATSSDGVSWSNDAQIPNMGSSNSPTIAAFNGYLYMLHESSNGNGVWMARFNTTTWSWDPDFELPYTSTSGTPSMASFDGSLYIIGSNGGQMWQATMSTAEVFSTASNLSGFGSPNGPPSLTVECTGTFCSPILYMAYRSSSGQLTMSGMQAPRFSLHPVAPSWWTPWVVAETDGTLKLTTDQPAIAAYGGYLHIIRTAPAFSDRILWTYYDGSNWSTDVSIANQEMWGNASLAPRAERLVMVHSMSVNDHSNGDYQVYGEYFQ